MTVKPSHFDKFKCIASKCPDTCCAGWEIDLDPDTAGYYSSLEGENGEFVRDRIIDTCDGQKLCLEGERCRFLRRDNLCELILRLGEDSLCDICREHPRFYSFFDGITEMGIGLCCPEGARLWLEEDCDFVVCEDEEPVGEEGKACLSRQLELTDRLLHGDEPLGRMLGDLICDGTDGAAYAGLKDIYSRVEVLDASFTERFSAEPTENRDPHMRRLAAYFLFRYYFELGEETAIKFTAASLIMIAAMGGDILVSCKDYSKEIEYDTDNLDMICGFLENSKGIADLCLRVLCC